MVNRTEVRTGPAAGYTGSVRILLWDVHGGYTDALLGGSHEYLYCRDDSPEQVEDFGVLVSNGLRRLDGARPAGCRR